MKLTDIDLSSLAEVGKAISFLVHVEGQLVNGDTPLPELIVNPADRRTSFAEAASTIAEDTKKFTDLADAGGLPLPGGGIGQLFNPAPTADPEKLWGLGTKVMDAALAADAEKLRGLGVDPITAQPLATGDAVVIQGLGVGTIGEAVTSMDAASIFGGAPAQSAVPLPQSAPASAGVAASPTAPVAPPASGTGVTALPALAPLPAPSAAAPAAPVALSSPAGGVELDTDGLPWDARIHAGTKRRNADGRWTAKKGINDPDLVPRVVAQLRAQMAAGGLISGNINAQPVATAAAPHVVAQSATPLPQSVPAPSTPPLAALPATSGPASLAAPTPPVLPVAQTPAAQQQYSAPAPTTFQDFMTALTVEVQAGRVPIEALGAACQPLGGVSALNAKPELIPVAWASLKAKYPGML